MRPLRYALLALLLALLAGGLLVTPAQGLGKVKCDNTPTGLPTVKVGHYDPIVNHNGTGSAHEHQFFGSRGWLDTLPNPNAATVDDLRAGLTDCRVPIDTAGYWSPTLRYVSGPNAGPIPVQQFTAYYRPATGVGGPDFGPAVTIPADTRLVATTFNWSCGQNNLRRQPPIQRIPDCSYATGKPGDTLTAHVDLPTCMRTGYVPNHQPGDVGDTRDNGAFAMKNGKYITKGACPAAGYTGVTAIRETFQFDYQGDGTDVALSSDPAGATPGSTMHADFWQTWQPDFNTWLDKCVRFQSQYSASVCQP